MDEERLRIMRDLDVDAALPSFRKFGFAPARHPITGMPVPEREVVLCSLHYGRVKDTVNFTSWERAVSRAWLSEHGYRYDREVV